MKRTIYKATLAINGEPVAETTAYAFNSGIRASEALLREYARSIGQIFSWWQDTE